MKAIRLCAVLASVWLCGCGVKFAASPVNKTVPESFARRAVFTGSFDPYCFQDIVGNILSVEPDKDAVRIDVIRPAGYVNEVVLIEDSLNYYRSRIQTGAEAQGAYLLFAAKFSSEDLAELTLDDVARAGIELKEESTWAELRERIVTWVMDHPNPNPGRSRLWIKSAVLSRKVYTGYTKIDSSASGQVGEVTGVKTGVYRKDEESIRSVILGVEAFDIDLLARGLVSVGLTGRSREDSLKTARFTGVITGTLPKK